MELLVEKYCTLTFGLIYPAILGAILFATISPDQSIDIQYPYIIFIILYFCSQFMQSNFNTSSAYLDKWNKLTIAAGIDILEISMLIFATSSLGLINVPLFDGFSIKCLFNESKELKSSFFLAIAISAILPIIRNFFVNPVDEIKASYNSIISLLVAITCIIALFLTYENCTNIESLALFLLYVLLIIYFIIIFLPPKKIRTLDKH